MLGCVVYVTSERLGPIRVRNELPGARMVAGDAGVADWLTAHGVTTEFTHDIRLAQWRKLLLNAAGNSLTGILRSRFGGLRTVPEIEAVARAAVNEVAAVGRAEGVALGPEDVEATLATFAGLPDDKTTSTLQDIESGRPLEVDALDGRRAAQGVGPRHRRPHHPRPRRLPPLRLTHPLPS